MANICVDDVIEFLNSLLTTDREAMSALFAQRVPCNEAMANHPTVQVGQTLGRYNLSALGILNGLFGTIEDGDLVGWGKITACWEDESGLLEGFDRTEKIAGQPKEKS